MREIAELPNKSELLQIVQIKEKFGSLRIYTHNSCIAIDTIITNAEMLCEKTCENCGTFIEIEEGKKSYSRRCKNCWKDRDKV